MTKHDPTPNVPARHVAIVKERLASHHGPALTPDSTDGLAAADRESRDCGSIHAWESEGGALSGHGRNMVSGTWRRMATR
jgi:hypothetical protein